MTIVISEGGVDEHQLRLHRARFLERGGRSVHRSDDLQVRLLGEHGDDSIAHQPIVLDYQDRDSLRHGCAFAARLA